MMAVVSRAGALVVVGGCIGPISLIADLRRECFFSSSQVGVSTAIMSSSAILGSIGREHSAGGELSARCGRGRFCPAHALVDMIHSSPL